MPTLAKSIPYLRIENLQKPYPIPRHVPIEPRWRNILPRRGWGGGFSGGVKQDGEIFLDRHVEKLEDLGMSDVSKFPASKDGWMKTVSNRVAYIF